MSPKTLTGTSDHRSRPPMTLYNMRRDKATALWVEKHQGIGVVRGENPGGRHASAIPALNCAQDNRSNLNSKRKSNSTGSSGFTFKTILPNVGKKLSSLSQKINSGSSGLNMGGKSKDKLGNPRYTSSTPNIGRTDFDIKITKKNKDDRKSPKLVRSQSVRVESRPGKGLDQNPINFKPKRTKSVGSADSPVYEDIKTALQSYPDRSKKKEKTRHSVDNMVEEFHASSNIVEMSNKLVMPAFMNSVLADVNNNDKIVDPLDMGQPMATGTVRRTSSSRRRNRSRKQSDSGSFSEKSDRPRRKSEGTIVIERVDFPELSDRHNSPTDDRTDSIKSDWTERTDSIKSDRDAQDEMKTGQQSRGRARSTELELIGEEDELPILTKHQEDDTNIQASVNDGNKPEKTSTERERLEELKEAQDRVTRRRTPSSGSKPGHGSGRDRSRSKDRSRKRSTGTDIIKPKDFHLGNSSPPSGDCQNGFDARTDGTDSGVGADATERCQIFGNHTDPASARPEGQALDADEMLARATKAIQEHVKDVTEKTRATCCIGKPPAKKESYNNQYNTQYHGGIKETNFNHHPINNNYNNAAHQQENHRPPPAYTHSPPPPYHSDHHTHNPKQNYQVGHHQHVTSPHKVHAPYPGDTRLPPPPLQSPLIINNHSGHISSHAPRTENLQYIINENTGTTYLKGRLLGKGGFAKCYELTDVKTNKTYAGKIISKNRLTKPHQKEKILREIELHKALKNRHVVAFHSYFEDNDCVYIILECCSMKSLVHVLKNRKTMTEPEVRYFMRHLVEGCRYIHQHKVIHRDLKLGNMLLNDKMQTKIADFGLATRVEYEGEKKMTVCGTPNYIAPEVLQKKGHSYEADIWALGCIMYALLVGKPPFETSTLKETYVRITANKYFVPPHVTKPAKNLITKLLAADPHQRPSLDKILSDEFFSSGHSPKTLPTSCCEYPPKFQTSSTTSSNVSIPSRPRSYAAPVSSPEAMQNIQSSLAHLKHSRKAASQIITKTEKSQPADREPGMKAATSQPNGVRRSTSAELRNVPSGSAIRLYQILTNCLEQMPEDANPAPVHTNKQIWVTKWVDYSNKYGFGFQLSDKSVGILFNDTTRMLLANDGKTCQYNDLSNKVYTFTTDTAPEDYQKKVTLLLYFAQYMDEHLIHGGDMVVKRGEPVNPTGIFMKKWFRTSKAIVMYLNNGTLQVNFFDDHTKVILSPDSQDYLVTYINSLRTAVTYRLLQFRHFGCDAEIQERLRYARRMLESIINIEGEAV